MTNLTFLETDTVSHGVRNPGLPVLPQGVERHEIAGGGSRAVEVVAGDEIWVVDLEGGQPGELVFFDKDGVSKAGYLGTRNAGRPEGLEHRLRLGGLSGQRTLKALKLAGFNLDKAEAVRLFPDGSHPNAHVGFTAERDGLVIVGSVGEDMSPMNSDTLTDYALYIKRRINAHQKGEFVLPDPLGKSVYDHTLTPGTAHSYEVKAGQFFQVIDVRGRECTDFQAFIRRDLDRGIESCIDTGATRSITGTFHPSPGLFSKYYSTNLEPMMEIVQDTMGRHDTFALACTGRYYEDLGYFGHSNCSENMSNALASYEIRPRLGWPSVNFFFNMLDDNPHAICSGEPWSRPGDYVMMRALTDLVCVNSCCPDEIDPANGWNPSEIHVRVYDEKETFETSKGYRMTPASVMKSTKKSAFHKKFDALGAEFVEYAGFFTPCHFRTSTLIDEYWACRDATAIMDLSALRKAEITGPDAEAFMNNCVTRDMTRLGMGGVTYTAMCSKTGGMIDDGTVMRMTQTNFRWVGGSDASVLALKRIAAESTLNVTVRSSTDQLCNLALQGRGSRDILAGVFSPVTGRPTVPELKRFQFTIARHGGENGVPVMISRTGFTGELGYEVFCHPRDAETVFDLIWEAGQPHGLMPIGTSALDILRVEAGLVMAGSEFDLDTTPCDAGIGFTVPLRSKESDFIGRAALEQAKAGQRKKLVGLRFEGGEDPLANAPVFKGATKVGHLTSTVRSPGLGGLVALARVDATAQEPGTAIEVGDKDGAQKRLLATVAPLPLNPVCAERVNGEYNNA